MGKQGTNGSRPLRIVRDNLEEWVRRKVQEFIRFESRVLPMFARRTAEVNKLIPQLYLHGLAPVDFDLALRGLLGEEAPVSASTVARLKEGWQGTP